MSFNTDSTKPALSSVQRNVMFTTLGLHFLTIYKAFIKPHLDCSDLICDKLFIESRHLKLESAQYSVALAITEAFWETNSNTEKLYQKWVLESLQNRRKLRSLSLFYKLHEDQSPLYLFNLVPAKLSLMKIVLMKFVFVEIISNLQTISSSNIPYFLKKGKSAWIKFVILRTHLLT